MEQVLDWLGTILRVMLAGMFALTPGTLFWLAVLGIVLTVRRLVAVVRTAGFSSRAGQP